MPTFQHSLLQELLLMGKKPFHWKTPSYMCPLFLAPCACLRLSPLQDCSLYKLPENRHQKPVRASLTARTTQKCPVSCRLADMQEKPCDTISPTLCRHVALFASLIHFDNTFLLYSQMQTFFQKFNTKRVKEHQTNPLFHTHSI